MSTKFGIITVSDSCSAGEKSDTAGTRLIEAVKRRFVNAQVFRKIVADEKDEIIKVLQELTDIMDVVLTTGGTGFSERDVTPEATRAVIEKEAPGLAYAMVSRSLQITEMAMLSRAVCGIRKKSLIVNLPGSAKAAVECFGFIQEVIPHAIALLTDNKDLVTKEHNTIQKEAEAQFTESKVKVGKVAARSRQSPYPMVEVKNAQEIIFRETQATLYIDVVPFEESINRILAEDIIAPESVPPFRASIKDGYAVKSADGAGVRNVVEVAAAGDTPERVIIKDGEAVRISTGAPIPEGADAVVQVEDTILVDNTADNTTELKIEIKTVPKLGQDIREIGSDVKAGEHVLNRYDRITPAHIGILAMLGIKEVKILRAPLIGVISTGNEVQHPRDELKPGQIRDCNKYTLLNFLRKYYYQPRDCGLAKDNPNSIKSALEEAFAKNDFVITSGGVSMGEFDIIKKVLVEDFNAIIHFGRVNMKPGKPTTFATLIYNEKVKIFFGLPGNPASCCVTCILFVIPALRYFERSSVTVFPTMDVHYNNFNFSRICALSPKNEVNSGTSLSNQNTILGGNTMKTVEKTKANNSGSLSVFGSLHKHEVNDGTLLNNQNSIFGTKWTNQMKVDVKNFNFSGVCGPSPKNEENSGTSLSNQNTILGTNTMKTVEKTEANEHNRDDRPDYQRVIVKCDQYNQRLTSSSHNNQVSSKLNSMVGANGLAIVEKNQNPESSSRKTIIFDHLC